MLTIIAAYELSRACLRVPLLERIRNKNGSVDSLLTPRSKSLKAKKTSSPTTSNLPARFVNATRSMARLSKCPDDPDRLSDGLDPCILVSRLITIETERTAPQWIPPVPIVADPCESNVAQPTASLTKRCSSTPDMNSFCWENLISEHKKSESLKNRKWHEYAKPAKRPKLARGAQYTQTIERPTLHCRSVTDGGVDVGNLGPAFENGYIHRMMRGSFSESTRPLRQAVDHCERLSELDYARSRGRRVFDGALHSMMYGSSSNYSCDGGEDNRYVPLQPPTTPEEMIENNSQLGTSLSESNIFEHKTFATEDPTSNFTNDSGCFTPLPPLVNDNESGQVKGDKTVEDTPRQSRYACSKPIICELSNPKDVRSAMSTTQYETSRRREPSLTVAPRPPCLKPFERPPALDPINPYRKNRRPSAMSSEKPVVRHLQRCGRPNEGISHVSNGRQSIGEILFREPDYNPLPQDSRPRAKVDDRTYQDPSEDYISTSAMNPGNPVAEVGYEKPYEGGDGYEHISGGSPISLEEHRRRRSECMAQQLCKSPSTSSSLSPAQTAELISEISRIPSISSRPRGHSSAASQLSPITTNTTTPDNCFMTELEEPSAELVGNLVHDGKEPRHLHNLKEVSSLSPCMKSEPLAVADAPDHADQPDHSKHTESHRPVVENDTSSPCNKNTDPGPKLSASAPQLTMLWNRPTSQSSSSSPKLKCEKPKIKCEKHYCIYTLSDGNDEIEQVTRSTEQGHKRALCIFGEGEDILIPDIGQSEDRSNVVDKREKLLNVMSILKSTNHKETHDNEYRRTKRLGKQREQQAPQGILRDSTPVARLKDVSNTREPGRAQRSGALPKQSAPDTSDAHHKDQIHRCFAADEERTQRTFLRKSQWHTDSLPKAILDYVRPCEEGIAHNIRLTEKRTHSRMEKVSKETLMKRARDLQEKHRIDRLEGRLHGQGEAQDGSLDNGEGPSTTVLRNQRSHPRTEQIPVQPSIPNAVSQNQSSLPANQPSTPPLPATFSPGAPSPAETPSRSIEEPSPCSTCEPSFAPSVQETALNTQGGGSPTSNECSEHSSCAGLQGVSTTEKAASIDLQKVSSALSEHQQREQRRMSAVSKVGRMLAGVLGMRKREF